MAYSRRLGVIGMLGVCFFVAVGCDDSDDKNVKDAEGGEAGESAGGSAGSGGKSTGGSQNNAGKGGKATGGAAGSTTAGTAGTANGGGEGGTAGEGTGGLGGEGNTSTPLGGAGADGGGGEPGGGAGGAEQVAAKSCGDQCEVSDDCIIADSVEQKVCDPVAKRCVEPFHACEAHDDCLPWASSFTKTCANQADCDDVSGVCVAWNGTGYCAAQPFEGTCIGRPGAAATKLLQFGTPDPSMVDVCLSTEGRCNAGECIVSCTAVGGCEGSGDGDQCNEDTGLCECQTADECGGRECGADNHCVECVTGADCDAQATGLDTCVNGSCGCSSPDSCIDQTANATPVCE
jgi:hypothetical protein